MDPVRQRNPVDQGWDPGTFDFGFEENIVELIEDILEEDSFDDLSSFPEPKIPPHPVYETGSPEDTREKRYTPRRGAWCGHEAVLRTWPSATSPKCQHCGNSDRWLWACTADTPDHSPFNPDPEPIIRDVSILAPWMQKAIVRGEYTDVQVKKLLDQKIKVLEQSASERRRVAQQGSKKPGSSKVVAASLSQAVDSQLGTDDERASDKVITPSLPETSEPAKTCRLVVCQTCKPRFIEQGWGGINAIVNEPYLAPPQIPEYLDRPISNATTLRNMREHCRDWIWSPQFQLWWETARFVGGYDLLPMLLMAEMIGSNQTHFIDFIGHMVLYRRMTRSQMCQCLYLLSPEACTLLVPFLGDDACFIPCHPERLAVDLGLQPIQEEEESQ